MKGEGGSSVHSLTSALGPYGARGVKKGAPASLHSRRRVQGLWLEQGVTCLPNVFIAVPPHPLPSGRRLAASCPSLSALCARIYRPVTQSPHQVITCPHCCLVVFGCRWLMSRVPASPSSSTVRLFIAHALFQLILLLHRQPLPSTFRLLMSRPPASPSLCIHPPS